MQGVEIINRLKRTLPQYTDRFSISNNVASAALIEYEKDVDGNIFMQKAIEVTLETADVNIKEGNTVKINGLYVTQDLTIQFIGADIYQLSTVNANQNYKGQSKCLIMDENGVLNEFSIIQLTNTKEFEVMDSNGILASGSHKLYTPLNALGDVLTVTKVSGAVLTFDIDNNFNYDAVGINNGSLNVGFRIREQSVAGNFLSMIIPIEGMPEPANPEWTDRLFVVTGGVRTQEQADSLSDDPASLIQEDTEKYLRLSQRFSIFYVTKTGDDSSNINAKYFADKLRVYLYKSIVGMKPSNDFSGSTHLVTPVQDDIYEATRAYYVHEFVFSHQFEMTAEDGVELTDAVTVVDILGEFNMPFDDYEEVKKSFTIKD